MRFLREILALTGVTIGAACASHGARPAQEDVAPRKNCPNGATARVVNMTNSDVDVFYGSLIGTVAPGSSGSFSLPPGPLGTVYADVARPMGGLDKPHAISATRLDPNRAIRVTVSCNP